MIAATAVKIHEGLTGLDYSLVAAYMMLMLGFGWWFSRRQTSAESYFVGGRKMPWLITGISVYATLFSTISYLGMPGEMIKKGIGILAGQIALPFACLFVALVIMPFYKRVPVTSAYEYLDKRFDLSVRWLGGALFMLIRVFWMSFVIYTASLALSTMTASNIAELTGMAEEKVIYVIIACVGLTATAYTCLGGIQAVIWTDFVQFLILAGGVVFTIGYVVISTGTGPVTWLRDAAEVGHTVGHEQVPIFSFDPTVRITIVGIIVHVFFWHACTHGSDQVAVQRYLSTPSLGTARRSLATSMICDFSLAVLLGTCGVALFSFYIHHPEIAAAIFKAESITNRADEVFPKFIGTQLPSGLAGLVVAALFAAAMSSLDSGVNSVSTVVTVDFYRRIKRGKAATAAALRRFRAS